MRIWVNRFATQHAAATPTDGSVSPSTGAERPAATSEQAGPSEFSLRPEITIPIHVSRIPCRIAWIATAFVACALLVPTAQISWWAKGLLVALAACSHIEARKWLQTSPAALRITANDGIELRRRYSGSHFSDFERVTPALPMFVSPWIVSMGLVTGGRILVFAGQVDDEDWRALRVRLKHLRTLA
jgi:hypothetical protein